MRWDEIDLDNAIWSLPAGRMKAGRPHRVPLSARAVAILRKLERSKGDGEFVFAGHAPGKPLSNMAMDMLLRRMNIDVTVHGFRSSFRDWAGNETPSPREVVETALAHVIGDKAEQAYRRSDALEKRRKLMEAWASYCSRAGQRRSNDERGRCASLNQPPLACLNPDFLNADGHASGRSWPQASCGGRQMSAPDCPDADLALDQLQQELVDLAKFTWGQSGRTGCGGAVRRGIAPGQSPPPKSGGSPDHRPKVGVSQLGKPVSTMNCTGMLIRPWLT